MSLKVDSSLDSLVHGLRELVGPEHVRDGPLDRELYSRDASILAGPPAVICFPGSADEVQGAVQICRRHGRAIVPRGSGTGLAGGAVPAGDPGEEPVIVVTTRLNRIIEIDPEERIAWVEPGVLNLDLSRAASPYGLHFAPDPSSQQACSVGGNVATNSGGPHCLAYGVTSAHVLALDVVLEDGSITRLGGLDPEPTGYDLRGAFIGSEGTMGMAVRIAVRLTPNPPAVKTIVLDFEGPDDAADTVSAIIAGGILPAALEMMDARITAAVEEYVGAGFPLDAGAVLIVEVDGLPGGVEAATSEIVEISRRHGGRSARVAADEKERALIWKGRKSAFGAVARIAPNYYLHDTVVPRTKLSEVLAQVYEIAARHELIVVNVFHAGDGNLHPLLVFDKREPGVLDRVHKAGDEIIAASVAAGGVLSGEHGIGLEKRDHMPLVFSQRDLESQTCLRRSFDPVGLFNPNKVLPAGSRCGDVQSLPKGVWV